MSDVESNNINYYQLNKTSKLEYQKEYYDNHRDERIEYQKTYNSANSDKLKEYQKQYYEKYREEKLKKLNEKITCDCGKVISRSSANKHLKTKLHEKLLRQMSEKNIK